MPESFLWGLIGGAIDEVLHWGALRRRATLPTYLRSPLYWLITLLLILTGGIVSYAAATSVTVPVTRLSALVIGFSAPALVKKLSKVLLSSAALGPGPGRPSWKAFLSD
jgi:hypothetical protein